MTLARPVLWAATLISALLIAVRAWIGPYSLVNSPMNAEGVFAMSALLLLICGMREVPYADTFAIPSRWCIAAVLAVTLAAYWPTLRLPLLFDDYPHLVRVLRGDPGFWREQLLSPPPYGFYRPLGMFSYRLDSFWAGHHVFLWRLGNLLPHSANCVLLYFLGRRLGLATWTAGFAAMLFGVHGSRMESAGWVAARFDLLAGFFVLAGLLLLFRFHERPAPRLLIAALAMCLLALLSKEAAYVFPVLATLLFWRKLSARVLGSFYALTAVVFVYRWWLLGGIGGYQTPGGEPTIFLLSATRMVKALLWRLWATLWFPIDWSHTPGLPLALALTAMLAACVWLFWQRPAVHWPALGFTLAAALPVQHLLLIGPDLNGSRVLYLPSIGFSILLAFALQSALKPRFAGVAALAIVVFHLAALHQNSIAWARASDLSKETCVQVGEAMRNSGRDAIVTNLPRFLDGAFFLENGFEACVEWNTGVAADRVVVLKSVDTSPAVDDRLLFRWEPDRGLVRLR